MRDWLRRVRQGLAGQGSDPGSRIARDDARRIDRLRARGVTIGAGCRIYTDQFSTEPWLVTLGDNVNVAGGVCFLTHDGAARLLAGRRPRLQVLGRIVVGSRCFIGHHAMLLPGTVLGDDCIVGAGAVVRGRIADNSLVVGNPGRVEGRASLYLEMLLRSPGAVDSFGLDEPDRRRMIELHFKEDGHGS